MNVCLLGQRGEQLDEGIKNTSVQLQDHLSDRVDSLTLLDIRDAVCSGFWKKWQGLNPDIIHLIPGPTPQGLALLQLLGRWKDSKTVATATQPRIVSLMLYGASVLAPHQLIVQSKNLETQFSHAGFETSFIPSGVSLDTFAPVSESRKRTLRCELNLPVEKRLFLHVGHFKEGRNLTELVKLQKFGEVVVIGSPSTRQDQRIISELRSIGCIVLTEYIDNIEQYYQASDIYVFPTLDVDHSIQVPLSVFEAMACNLPIITTRFGGLEDCFDEGGGFQFASEFDSIQESTLTFDVVETRQKVSEYSWESIANAIYEIYKRI